MQWSRFVFIGVLLLFPLFYGNASALHLFGKKSLQPKQLIRSDGSQANELFKNRNFSNLYAKYFKRNEMGLEGAKYEDVEKYDKATDSWKTSLAKAMGYIMGAGAMFIYTPIFIKLLQRGNADGFSMSTWIFNFLGLMLATVYPMKKGYPLSTFIDLLAATSQSVLILLVLSIYQHKVIPVVAFLLTSILGAGIFLKIPNVSSRTMNWFQIVASLLANYANFPQIILSFQTKQAAWSGVTALMSMIGCTVRIFTTIQLTNDPVTIGGYVLGLVTNSILLAQVLFYNNK